MLKVQGIQSYYGESHILHGVDLEISKGEVVCLLGRNGAGKTTTLRSVMGLTPPRAGSILLNGENIAGKKAYEVGRMGVAWVPEERRIFKTLTVMENLLIAERKGDEGKWTIDRIMEIFTNLARRRQNRGDELSGGEQQMLAVARALMRNPQLILLDEPTEGLAPIMVDAVMEVIERIKEEGVTIFLVEQNVDASMKVAHRHYILEQGKVVAHIGNDELKRDRSLREKYLSI
ncbi:MAG: ABC transporter ATP-binding protein [Deltaproteobacteria bacterium]|nr:ABC transporter ATP-binding protein [Deltaproteobacteria bacterium]